MRSPPRFVKGPAWGDRSSLRPGVKVRRLGPMKRAFGCWVALWMMPGWAMAQEGAGAKPGESPEAAALMSRVQARYEQVTDFQASFRQVVTSRSPRRTFTRSGTVWFKRPGKMRWDYQVPDRVHYVSDGEVLWSYDVAEGTAWRLPVRNSDLYHALGFLTGTARLAEVFEGTVGPARPDGLVPLRLVPRQATDAYRAVTLFVDPRTGDTRETEVEDPIGNLSRIRFENPSFAPLPDSGFAFRPPKGVTVKDLETR